MMGAKVVLVLLSAVCCSVFPLARGSVDEVISGVHLEDTWRTLTEADLRAELHLPRDSHVPFHTIAKLSTVRRKRRDVEEEGSSKKLAFSLRLSNVTHSFAMSYSTDILSPHYVLEEVTEDGRLVTIPSSVKDCYYIQELRQTGLSAVTVCNHTVEGVVVDDDHSYMVQPRSEHPDEVIVWEMDERTLPRGVTDGRSMMCPIPDAPLDGAVSWTERDIGATLYYYCNEGFDLLGTASQECLSSGEWSSSTPLCMPNKGETIRVTCPPLKCPAHGAVGVAKRSAAVTEAVYMCDEGFVLHGEHKRYCQRNGQWTGKDPFCTVAPLSEEEMEGRLREGDEDVLLEGLRQKRGAADFIDKKEVIELVVYVDKQLYDRYKGNRAALEQHILAILNLYAAIMQEPSIGRPICIRVVRIIIETGPTQLSATIEASGLAGNFCAVQSALNMAEGHALHHDYAILITGRDLCSLASDGTCSLSTIGYAPVSSMCQKDRSCAIVEHYGLQCAFTVAHETGHGLSMEHDYYRNTCPDEGGVMAASLGRGVQLYEWSSCSAEELRCYRIAGGTHCLMEMDPGNDLVVSSYPGRQYDLLYQCKAMFGDHAVLCPFTTPGPCPYFYCKYDNSGYCYTKYMPALDGTKCGTNKECRHGVCVKNETCSSINGGWGTWTKWSDCSRTCGGGVQCRMRKCNSPTPKCGGEYCEGPEAQCQLCNENVQCPTGSDFRTEQCTNYNQPFRGRSYTWQLFDRTTVSRCSLVCLAVEGNFWAILGTMKDGTPCPATEGFKDARCVKGNCLNIGCDGCLDSGVKVDKCGVCGGDGSTCTLCNDTFQEQLSTFGYHNRFTIPADATCIQITEVPINPNVYLAVTAGALPQLNGGLAVVTYAVFQAGGAQWTYSRTATAETLVCPGPLNTSVSIQILKGNGVTTARFNYQFYKPKPTTTAPPPTTQTTSPPTTPPTTPPPTNQTATLPPTTQPTTPPLTTQPTTPPLTTQPTTPPLTTQPTTPPPTTQTTTRHTTPPSTPTGDDCPDECRSRYTFCSALLPHVLKCSDPRGSGLNFYIDCCCQCSPACAQSSSHC